MAPQTSSFITDIEEAVLAELRTKCGTGSTVYPTPAYLLLVSASRGEVVPRIEINETLQPGLLMQYISGGEEEAGIGISFNVERWNIGAVIRLTPSVIGYAGSVVTTFRQYAAASADTLARRLRKTLRDFKPGIRDATFGEVVSGKGWVKRWGIVPTYLSDFEVMYLVLLEYELRTEQTR